MAPTLPASRLQRLHDLRGIHADFKSTLRLLESGYRFDDEDAPAALTQLKKAVAHFEEELKQLEQEWRS
jgi:hypothetical protein